MQKMSIKRINRQGIKKMFWPSCSLLAFLMLCASSKATPIIINESAASVHYVSLGSNKGILDVLHFGNTREERKHGFQGAKSRRIKGGLQQTARILMPRSDAAPEDKWQGASMTFVIKTDPVRQNYITTRFWGDDVTQNRLYFVSGNKQIGTRHLGEIDMLDIGTDYPLCNDRFYYTTLPLPLSLTKGKSELKLEIRSQGPIWGYGHNWKQYQKDMTRPSRGIYAVYTHTNTRFVPPGTELEGTAPIPRMRSGPGVEVLEVIKEKLNREIDADLAADRPLSQVKMQLLAKAYSVQWSHAYQNPEVIRKVTEGLDELYRRYSLYPQLAHADPATYNAEWFGLGICGQIIYLLKDPLSDSLMKAVQGISGKPVMRKEGYVAFLEECRDWHRRNRRMYSNQSMINDLYGIYYANKGLEAIAPDAALPESRALTYLHQSLGMTPWTGSENREGHPSYSAGKDYWELTPKGLTKELGFVGNYGEVLDWASEIYDATKSKSHPEGDTAIRTQIIKIAKARSWFRYPMSDDAGYRSMRQETVVGWRDTHYPGDVTYAQRPSWDGTPLQIAALTMDPELLGYTTQMLDDNQFFYSLLESLKDNGFRSTAGLLPVPDQYVTIMANRNKKYRLPMSEQSQDFVFSDEQDGVIAVKNGPDRLYVSLYWRARNAINNLARVHLICPHYDQIATVYINEKFDSSGLFFKVPSYTNLGFGNGGLKYPDGLHAARSGEQQPIAKIPAEIPYRQGQEHHLAGRADLYEMQYGQYYIALNASKNKTFEILVPDGFRKAKVLSHTYSAMEAKLMLKPNSTIVLYQP